MPARHESEPSPEPRGERQGSSASDLRRHPPKSETCRQIRNLLRDHADGELPAEESRLVEEHVHVCADCDRALSRTELELMRIRGAFAGDEPEAVPPADFTAVVMARVRAEAAAEAEQEALANLRGFTPRVVARVRAEAAGGRRFPRRRGRWVALPVAAAVLLAAVALLWFGQGGPDATRVQVVAAIDADWLRDPGVEVPLRDGMRFELPATVRTRESGRLRIGLPPVAPAERGTTIVELGGAGAAALEREAAELDRGVLAVETTRPFTVRAGGSELRSELHGGRFLFTREAVRRLDGLGDEAWRTRIEVIEGLARVHVGAGEPLDVPAGSVLTLAPAQAPRLEASAATVRLRGEPGVASGAVPTPAPPATNDTWAGQLVDGLSGEPLGGAALQLTTATGVQALTTDGAGRFLLPVASAPDGALVLLRVGTAQGVVGDLPHPSYGPVPWLIADGGRIPGHDGPALAPFRVPPERVLAGRVLDADQRPLAEARVTPVLVDELTGGLHAAAELAVTADAAGRFRLRRLAAALLPHQRLALLVLHPEQPAMLFAEPIGPTPEPRDQDLLLQLPREDLRRVVGLAPQREQEFLVALPHVAIGSALRRQFVAADPDGRALLPDGGTGEVWSRGRDGELRRLQPARGGTGDWELGPAPDSVTALRIRGALAAAGTEAGAVGLAPNARFARLAAPGPADQFATARAAGTLLFAVPEDGSGWTLLGRFDGRQPIGFPAVAGSEALVALAPDGAIGRLDAPDLAARTAAGETMFQLLPSELAQVALDPALAAEATAKGGLLVRWTRRDGAATGTLLLRRFAGGRTESIALPPGEYEFALPDGRSGTVTLAPASTAVIGV